MNYSVRHGSASLKKRPQRVFGGASRPKNRSWSTPSPKASQLPTTNVPPSGGYCGIIISRRKAAITSNLPYIHTPSAYSILDTPVI